MDQPNRPGMPKNHAEALDRVEGRPDIAQVYATLAVADAMRMIAAQLDEIRRLLDRTR